MPKLVSACPTAYLYGSEGKKFVFAPFQLAGRGLNALHAKFEGLQRHLRRQAGLRCRMPGIMALCAESEEAPAQMATSAEGLAL